MKGAISVAALALAGSVSAFPSKMFEAGSPLVKSIQDKAAKRQVLAGVAPQGAGFLPLVPPPFDAASQYITNQGQYKFVAPGFGDARGECPGLNAMANHNYLPHNGVATIQQFIDATNHVFGMAVDLGGFLAFFGAIVDGDGSQWSIEGVPHTGIAGSHNDYEGDSSPLKSDLNQYGSNERLIMSQFYTLYNMQPDASTANYNLEVLTAFRGKRYAESIAKNPYFSYLPFSGIEVSQAAFTFIYRFMANKSAEYPEGRLDKNVLKSFMSISGPENNLKWTKGYERIPDNWYKRNDADQYSIPYFEADIVSMAVTQPELLVVGCNQGTVNSFNAIDPATLSSGAYDAKAVAANPLCFTTSFLLAEAPGTFGLTPAQTAQLSSYAAPLLSGCPTISKVNTSAFTACPGFSLYGGPYAPVAPGAIQS